MSNPAHGPEAAALVRGLRNNEPLTMEEALDFVLSGWNLRCNRCGSWGATWVTNQRPGWGSLALCDPHRGELLAELRRHEQALAQLRAVNFEQVPAAEVDQAYKAYKKARKAGASRRPTKPS